MHNGGRPSAVFFFLFRLLFFIYYFFFFFFASSEPVPFIGPFDRASLCPLPPPSPPSRHRHRRRRRRSPRRLSLEYFTDFQTIRARVNADGLHDNTPVVWISRVQTGGLLRFFLRYFFFLFLPILRKPRDPNGYGQRFLFAYQTGRRSIVSVYLGITSKRPAISPETASRPKSANTRSISIRRTFHV